MAVEQRLGAYGAPYSYDEEGNYDPNMPQGMRGVRNVPKVEQQLINEMNNLDSRGLSIMSKEEMANRGLFYDENSGTYKYDDPHKVSVTIPGQRAKTFTPNETQFVKMADQERLDYRDSPEARDALWHSKSGTVPFYPPQHSSFIDTDVYRPGVGRRISEFQVGSPYSPEVESILKRDTYGGNPYEGDYTPLASRTTYPSNTSKYDLLQYQNMAHYLDQSIKMPFTMGETHSWADFDTGEIKSSTYESDSGELMASDAKQKAIDQMTNIHLQGMVKGGTDLRGYDMHDIYLQDEGKYDPNVDVTDIVRGLKRTRDESQYNIDVRNPRERQETVELDQWVQGQRKGAYDMEREGWWLGKLLGRDKPGADVQYDESTGRYTDTSQDY